MWETQHHHQLDLQLADQLHSVGNGLQVASGAVLLNELVSRSAGEWSCNHLDSPSDHVLVENQMGS